jgi:hypothetical protein
MNVKIPASRRAVLLLFSFFLLTLSLMQPASAVTRLCCLDEWQGLRSCTINQRVAAYCTGACDVCGAMFCQNLPSNCLR